MKLSERARYVAVAAQFNADAPVSWLRRRTGLRDHSIYSDLRSLRESGVIRPCVLVDVDALGMMEIEVYIELGQCDLTTKMQLFRKLLTCPQTLWVAELAGKYNVGASLCIRSTREGQEILEQIFDELGLAPLQLSIGMLVSFTLYRKRYLVSKDVPDVEELSDQISVRSTGGFSCDTTDYKVISALFRSREPSIRNVAKQAGLPRTTFEYRMERLREHRVISDRCFFISARKLGVLAARILLSLRSVTAEVREEFNRFCRENRNIVNLKQVLGAWDYELTVETSETEDLQSVTRDLREHFSANIRTMEVLTVLQQSITAGFLADQCQ